MSKHRHEIIGPSSGDDLEDDDIEDDLLKKTDKDSKSGKGRATETVSTRLSKVAKSLGTSSSTGVTKPTNIFRQIPDPDDLIKAPYESNRMFTFRQSVTVEEDLTPKLVSEGFVAYNTEVYGCTY